MIFNLNKLLALDNNQVTQKMFFVSCCCTNTQITCKVIIGEVYIFNLRNSLHN